MSEHKITLRWDRESEDFDYQTYNREHSVQFKNGQSVNASAAPAFLGKADFVDPEEMLVASYASCHMLTFLAIAAKKKLVVDAYEDTAIGHLNKNAEGKLAITQIDLFPKVHFENASLSLEELHDIHKKAHANCFIANSTTAVGNIHPIVT